MDSLLELLAIGAPDDPAIRAEDKSDMTYAALQAQTRRIGGELAALGVGPEDRVAIVLANGPTMATAFVCMSPWCTTAPLNPAYKAEEFDFYLDDLDAKVLLVDEASDSASIGVAEARGVPVVRVAETGIAGEFSLGVEPADPVERPVDATALILHTSGTTSRPKMVPLSQANLVASASNIAATLGLEAHDLCMNVMPLFHIHGLMAPVFASLRAGASVHCTTGFDALKFYGWLDTVRPTWYSAVPTMHQAILARARRNQSVIDSISLRFIRSSSASLPPQVMGALEETFGAPVIEAYAMTEAAHQMCSNPLPPRARKAGCVGPAAGPEVSIRSLDGTELAQGGEGEICIRGANVTTGYLNNPEANATAFHDDWFRTGDQGVMDEDGYVKITGRLKEIINRGGEKIAPLEIDEVLLDHPAVGQVCAFAVPHDKLGEDVGAAVVVKDGEEVSERDLRSFAAERLADFKVPRKILFVPEIPKGPTGKIQRIGLAKALGLDS